MSSAWGFDTGLYAMGIKVLDVDRNGYLDYFVTSIGRHQLFQNGVTMPFVDATDVMAIDSTFSVDGYHTGWGVTALDANGDGNVDIEDLLIVLGAWGPCP